MKTFRKTDKEIKDQIINWFLKYHKLSNDDFTGFEEFTLFEKLLLDKQEKTKTLLHANELAVLILKKDVENTIICTTRRFICLEKNEILELKYSEFNRHVGYKDIHVHGHIGPHIGVKTDGYISEFGLQKNDGQIIYWKIPTGKSGFAFWNITQKFEMIGRKYIIQETE